MNTILRSLLLNKLVVMKPGVIRLPQVFIP